MPYRYQHVEQGYFHIYNRGNEKATIFRKDKDFGYFISQMNRYRLKYSIEIICYCLMPNHFHLSLYAQGKGALINFMKQLQMVYAQYLQKQYNWVGHVFQGRYKASAITKESQFLYLSVYIHMNPKMGGRVNRLEEWKWSSYLDYIGLRNGKIPNKEVILNYFKSPEGYDKWANEVTREKLERRIAGVMIDN